MFRQSVPQTHDYYLTRALEYAGQTERIERALGKTPQGSIALVAIGLQSVATMTEQDKARLHGNISVMFLFLLKGFADIDEATHFLDAFLDNVRNEAQA